MKLGILGFPKSGKSTLFNLLTGAEVDTGKFLVSRESHVGIATVPDTRLAKLRDLYNPRKYVPATIEYVDIPGLELGKGAEGADLVALKSVDALVHVVRAFIDDEIPHPSGAIDPERDLVDVDLELILADHALVERRRDRLEQSRKRGLNRDEEAELTLLVDKVLPQLESELPLRALELSGDEEKRLRGFQLLSAKPMLVVVNGDEASLAQDLNLPLSPGVQAIAVSAPIEAEIALLDADDQAAFLGDLGLDEASLDRILAASYQLLGRISFFTVGEDEVRAWTIREGTTAHRAAGAIHSDIERGFIRAEVVPWDALLDGGSMSACRENATLRLEGKEYVVRDGDVVHFRFNV